MSRWNRALAAPVLALVVPVLVVAGCGSSDSSGSSAEPTAAVGDDASGVAAGEASAAAALEQGATVIDVRSPEEFAEGHVEGAALMSVEDPGFADRIAGLDPSVTYVVYCRSGNRSAVAAAQMREAGLEVLDGGGLDDMRAAGWPVGA